MSKEQREQQIINEVDNYRDGDPVMTKLLNRNAAIGLALRIAEWADFHPQWIPVEKELPPHRNKSEHKFENDFSDNCFVSDGEFIDVGYYDYRLHKWNCEFLTNVTCWYIPQPPRKEDKK